VVSIFLSLFVFLAVTYVAAPLGVFVAAARLMRPERGEVLPLFLLTAPAAPFAIALVMMAIYSLPWQTPVAAQICGIVALIGLVLILGRTQLRALREDMSELRRAFQWSVSIPGLVLGLVVVGLLGLIFLQTVTMPVRENDGVEYLAVAREIFQAGSLKIYPLTKSAQSGMFAPSAHPPAFHMLLVWGYSWLGVENFAATRAVATFCVLGMISLLAAALWRRGAMAITAATALLLSTPLYVLLLVDYHVDGLRIMAVAGVIVAMARVIATPDLRTGVLAGIWLGCAAFSHSIGVLSVGLAGLCWLVLGPADRFRHFGVPLVIGIVAILIGGAQYAKNMFIFGVPLHDHVAVWGLPGLRFQEDLDYVRGLASLTDRLLAGPLLGFVWPELFGLSYWIGLVGFVVVIRKWQHAQIITRISVIWFMLIVLLAMIGAIFNVTLLIKNARYLPFTAMPAIAIIVGSAATQILGQESNPRFGMRAASIGLTLYVAARRFFCALVKLVRALVLSIWPFLRFLRSYGAKAVLALVLAGIAFVLARWTIDQSMSRLRLHGARSDIFTAGERAAYRRPGSNLDAARIYAYLEAHSRADEKTLTFFQPGTAMYGTGRWIDQLDDDLIPFYKLNDADAAHAWLRARDVRYVFVPRFYLSTFSRSVTERLVADERYSEILINDRGWQLFRLRDEPLKEPYSCVALGPDAVFEEVSHRLGLRSRIAHAAARPELIRYTDSQVRKLRIFGEDRPPGTEGILLSSPYGRTHRIFTGEGPVWIKPKEKWLGTSGVDGPMRIEIETKDSSGFFIINIGEFGETPADSFQTYTQVWEGILDKDARRISFQFRPAPGSQKFRVLIDKLQHAPASISLTGMKICTDRNAGGKK
jgi:hypothetical protein